MTYSGSSPSERLTAGMEVSMGVPDGSILYQKNGTLSAIVSPTSSEEMYLGWDATTQEPRWRTTGELLVILNEIEAENRQRIVSFNQASYSVLENVGTLEIPVLRSGLATGAISVGILVVATSSATEGTDFVIAPKTLSWADGELGEKKITLSVINDSDIEPLEFVTLAFDNLQFCSIGGLGTTQITIESDDARGMVGFVQSQITVNENIGTVKVQLARTNGSNGVMVANVFAYQPGFYDGVPIMGVMPSKPVASIVDRDYQRGQNIYGTSATAPNWETIKQDFAVEGQPAGINSKEVRWEAGEMGVKEVTLLVNNDIDAEKNEFINLFWDYVSIPMGITAPQASALPKGLTHCLVEIVSDDAPQPYPAKYYIFGELSRAGAWPTERIAELLTWAPPIIDLGTPTNYDSFAPDSQRILWRWISIPSQYGMAIPNPNPFAVIVLPGNATRQVMGDNKVNSGNLTPFPLLPFGAVMEIIHQVTLNGKTSSRTIRRTIGGLNSAGQGFTVTQ